MGNKITLVVTSLDPDEEKLARMLESAKGFDEIILHIDAASKNKPNIDINRIGSPMKMIYHDDHLPIGTAFDFIISKIETEWICVFSDDDYFDEEGLREMLTSLRQGIDADIAHFKCHVSGNRTEQDWGNSVVNASNLENDDQLPAGSFFRKTVWEKVGGFKGTIAHDWIFWLRAARLGCRFQYFNVRVYHFVSRNGSAWFKQLNEIANGSWEKAREKVLEYATI